MKLNSKDMKTRVLWKNVGVRGLTIPAKELAVVGE